MPCSWSVGIEPPRRQDILTTIDQARWTTTVYIGAYFEWVSASVTRTYYYAGATRVAERIGATIYYLFGDHLSSTSVSYNASTAQIVRQWYNPWGNTRAITPTGGALPTDYAFTGQRLESRLGTPEGGLDRGLYFYGSRWYDSLLGRFLQADTIVPEPGNPQSLNRYSYVLNNALKYTDPTGHSQCQTPKNAKTWVRLRWVRAGQSRGHRPRIGCI